LFEPRSGEFEIFREENDNKGRNSNLSGSPFFWLLFFGKAKKSNDKQKGVFYYAFQYK